MSSLHWLTERFLSVKFMFIFLYWLCKHLSRMRPSASLNLSTCFVKLWFFFNLNFLHCFIYCLNNSLLKQYPHPFLIISVELWFYTIPYFFFTALDLLTWKTLTNSPSAGGSLAWQNTRTRNLAVVSQRNSAFDCFWVASSTSVFPGWGK